jgi:hypothetical protein
VSVKSLTERESPIATHFSKPQVQNIGSTSDCGCDFPHVMFQNGEWPWFDGDEPEPEREASDRYNRERLVALLPETREPAVELYGVREGDFDFTTPPAIREEISGDTILERGLRFKEQGFYVVTFKRADPMSGSWRNIPFRSSYENGCQGKNLLPAPLRDAGVVTYIQPHPIPHLIILRGVIGLVALARRTFPRRCQPQLLVPTRRFHEVSGARRRSVPKLRKRSVGLSANHDPM